MLSKIVFIILIINTYIILSDSVKTLEVNEPDPISSQIAELTAQVNRLNETIRKSDLDYLRSYPRNCAEATVNSKQSGIYEIHIPSYSKHPFKVTCDAETRGGNWTIILRRLDGSEIFYRNWNTFKKGFGKLDGEFFLGLDKIHALTEDFSQELMVILEDFEGDERYETYERFGISGEDEQYALNTLGKANGTAGDSLSYHHGDKFSTFDRDNDHWINNCAEEHSGAWWYGKCSDSNLAGRYNNTSHKGVNWNKFRDWNYSLKRALMMIRPRN